MLIRLALVGFVNSINLVIRHVCSVDSDKIIEMIVGAQTSRDWLYCVEENLLVPQRCLREKTTGMEFLLMMMM